MAEAKKATKKVTEAEVVEPVAEEAAAQAEAKLAKAGKRSAKAVKETEAKIAKEERKAQTSDGATEARAVTQKPTRSRLERRGKKYRAVAEKIEKDKVYSLKEGLGLAIATSPTKFDASVELHLNLNVDPKQADQNIRGSVALPSGTGKEVRIAVAADTVDAAKLTAAGAALVGEEKIFAALDKGQIDFDVLIALPAVMPKLGKYARLLGPKGLMPNPKSGTVTPDPIKAVTEAKAGRVEYRVDSTGIIHLSIGKVSFGVEKLEANAAAVIGAIKAAKPASIKGGVFMKVAYLSTSMGPSLKITTSES
ncbi:MAG: 50S ribosomal protein L1 [Candidatus Saccharibacteria bacterium]|nr:50S ribosomal protein L1 [Candidatus Saccharibacteria bacterium]